MVHNQAKTSYRPAFAIDSFFNFATQLLIFTLSFFSSIIIARTLGPYGKGVYSLVLLIPTMVASIINMGINSANIYYIGKKAFPINKIVGNAITYSICVGTTLTCLLLLIEPIIKQYFLKTIHHYYFYLTIPMIPFFLVIENIHYVLLAYRKMTKLTALRLIRPFIYVSFLIIFWYLLTLSIYNVIIANIFGLLAAIVIGFYFLIKDGYFTGFVTDMTIFAHTIRFGSKQHLGTIFQFLNYRVDMLIIAALLTNTDLGLYSISVLIAEIIWYLPSSVGQILYVKIAAETEDSADSFTPLICRSIVLVVFLACLLLYALSDIIIPWLFTSSFFPSVIALKLLLPGILSLSISKVLGSDLIGRGFPQYSTIAAGASFIATVILDLLLIPLMGINGAALASSIAYSINAFIIVYLFKKTSNVPLIEIFLCKKDDFQEYFRIIKSLKNLVF
jgi:O-antigen/teichoic acid export membrane protein